MPLGQVHPTPKSAAVIAQLLAFAKVEVKKLAH